MPVPARINIVTLGVADLARSVAFYDGLGWERCASSNQEIAWFRTAGAYLGLFPFEQLAADADLPPPTRGTFSGVTLAMNAGSEEETSAVLAAAAAAGATIIKPARRADWGGFSGYFADPDGYAWEVAYNPHFPIDEQGVVTIP